MGVTSLVAQLVGVASLVRSARALRVHCACIARALLIRYVYTARTLTHPARSTLQARSRSAPASARRPSRHWSRRSGSHSALGPSSPTRSSVPELRHQSCATPLSPRGARANTTARRPATATALVVRAVHAVRHVRHVVASCARSEEGGWVVGGDGGGLAWFRGGLALRNRCEPWAVQATRLRGAHDVLYVNPE